MQTKISLNNSEGEVTFLKFVPIHRTNDQKLYCQYSPNQMQYTDGIVARLMTHEYNLSIARIPSMISYQNLLRYLPLLKLRIIFSDLGVRSLLKTCPHGSVDKSFLLKIWTFAILPNLQIS